MTVFGDEIDEEAKPSKIKTAIQIGIAITIVAGLIFMLYAVRAQILQYREWERFCYNHGYTGVNYITMSDEEFWCTTKEKSVEAHSLGWKDKQ